MAGRRPDGTGNNLWIDMLVVFWVEATSMVCVGLAAIGLLARSRQQN